MRDIIFFFIHLAHWNGYKRYDINQKDKLEINRKRTFFSAKYAYEWESICSLVERCAGESECKRWRATEGGRSKHAHNVPGNTQRSTARIVTTKRNKTIFIHLYAR